MRKKVLFGVLNWGLGHASRSIQLIEYLTQRDHTEIVLASSGEALDFLSLRFPKLEIIEYPEKEIYYSGTSAKKALIKRTFLQVGLNKAQAKWLKSISESENITHIISDNIYGIYSVKHPSALISHQLNLPVPIFRKLIQGKLNKWLSHFHEIWIPDIEGEENLSGKLSKAPEIHSKIKYLGNTSHLAPSIEHPKKDPGLICGILSGPEPMRSKLENLLITLFEKEEEYRLVIVGSNSKKLSNIESRIKVYGKMRSEELSNLIEKSSLVICRSGYSSLLDLVKIRANALLIPTPGQPEQEYLAKRAADKNWFGISSNNELNIERIRKALNSGRTEFRFDSESNFKSVMESFLES